MPRIVTDRGIAFALPQPPNECARQNPNRPDKVLTQIQSIVQTALHRYLTAGQATQADLRVAIWKFGRSEFSPALMRGWE